MEELRGLKTKYLGRNLLYFDTIDSTQVKIKKLKHPKDGTIIIANSQISAIGTHDRKWYTGNGKNIAMSFVLIPDSNIRNFENLTTIIAQCLVEVIKKVCGCELYVKAPNDIYYKNKKVGGILTETKCEGENVKKIYIGIGLNVNQEEFPGNLNDIATSLKTIGNKEFDREKIIVEFLNIFEKQYENIIKNKKNSN